MTNIPDSSDLSNVHDGMGLNDAARRQLRDATKQAIEADGLTLHGEISHGASCVVFAAREKATGRKLAIKVIVDPDNPKSLELFRKEHRILSSEDVPSDIVPNLIFGRDENWFNPNAIGVGAGQPRPSGAHADGVAVKRGQPYLVMELIRGKKIHEYAAENELTLERRIDLVEKVFRALDRLHQANVVHGEYSPNNVLVEPGDRVRAIDFGQSRRLVSGYVTLTSVTSPGGTAGVSPPERLAGEERASLQSDLYEAASTAFHLFVGRLPIGLSERDLLRELTTAGVPRAVAAVIEKAHRTADKSLVLDPRLFACAADAANEIARWRTRRDTLRRAWKQTLVAAVLLIAVSLFAAVGWSKYEAERQAQDQRAYERLLVQVEKLPNHNDPAIRAMLSEHERLVTARQEALDRHQPREANKHLRDMLTTLEHTLATSRALEPLTQWLETVTKELQSKPIGPDDVVLIPWLTESPFILQRLKSLIADKETIQRQLARGETDSAHQGLVKLQAGVWELKGHNDRALSVREDERRYSNLRSVVSDRMKKEYPEFKTIESFATDAEEGWKLGKWDAAETTFGVATQRLIQFLEENGNPEEQAAREKQLQADREAGLLAEVRKLKAERDAARRDIENSQASVNALGEQLKQKDAEIAKEKTDAEKVRSDKAVVAKQLADLKSETNKTITAQKTSLDELSPKLLAAEAETNRWKSRAETAEKLFTTLPASASSGANEAARIVVDAGKIAVAIEAQIAQLDTSDREAAIRVFEAAAKAWQVDDRELTKKRQARIELLKTVADGGSDVLKIDAEIAALVAVTTRKEESLRQAVAKVDQTDLRHFDELESGIRKLESIIAEWADPKGKRRLLENNQALVTLRKQIAAFKSQQQPYAIGALRVTGRGKKLTMNEIASLAKELEFLPGDLRIIKVKGIETRWRWIPAGKFKMGSPANEQWRHNDENQVEVTISKGFWMQETEVTQELWTAVTGTTIEQQLAVGIDFKKWGYGPTYPIFYFISHNEAVKFCTKFDALLKSIPEAARLAVRLPTEAEWEYAARSGTTTRYYWGDDDSQIDQYAWHRGNSNGSARPVGQKTPNAWGLYDMSGNVCEWCADWYTEKLSGGIDPPGPSSGEQRVCRGNSWIDGSSSLRSACRLNSDQFDGFTPFTGIRMVCVSGPQP